MVDDNNITLTYYSTIVDWKKHGFSLAATAMDGHSALIEFKKHSPEVVITDIQMPNMNGLELAEEILKIDPDTIVIFLSSYEEFSYARSAMNLGVHDYILKHESKGEKFEKHLEGIQRTLQKQKMERRYAMERRLSKYFSNVNEFQRLDFSEIASISSRKYDAFLLMQDYIFPEISEQTGSYTEEWDEERITAHCYSFMQTLACVKIKPYLYFVLMKSESSFRRNLYSLQESIVKHMEYGSASLLILSEKQQIPNCIRNYWSHHKNIPQKYFFGKSLIVFFDWLGGRTVETPQKDKYDDLIKMLDSGDGLTICQDMDKTMQKAIDEKNYNSFSASVSLFLRVLLHYHIKLLDVENRHPFVVYQKQDENSWYDAASVFVWIKEKYITLTAMLAKARDKNFSSVVTDAVGYIHRHYNDCELSAEKVAAVFKMNINSLNNHIKKEMEETVWQLIIKVRMEKAGELLSSSHHRIFDIAGMVGYKAVTHFSKAFKSYFGCTPQEYRRKR